MDGQHISEDDLALYAMHALAPAQVAGFEAHMRSCADCQKDLGEIRGVLAAVALSVEQQAIPAGARDRFLTKVEAENVARVAPARTIAASDPTVPAAPIAGPVLVPAQRRRSLFPILLPWAAAAAMFVFAGYLHVQYLRVQQLLNNDRSQIATLSAQASRAQQVMDTLTSATAQQATLTEKPTAVPTGHTSYVPERGALVFVGNHLKQVPATKTYELWIIPANGSAPIAAGTFRPDANGTASVVLPPLPQGVPAKAFGVTIENEGGSQTPTMPIVLSGS